MVPRWRPTRQDQTCDMARLEKLLARTEDAISELEAQNKSSDEPSPPCLPVELQQAQVLRERIQHDFYFAGNGVQI